MNNSGIELTEDQIKVFDRTRYRLVNRAGIMFILILIVVALINLMNAHHTPIPHVIIIGLISFCLVLLHRTRNYRLVTKIAVSGATLTLIIALFSMRGMHLATPIWMVTCSVFTYLVLEKFWGGLITSLNFGSLGIYVMTVFEDRMNNRFLIQDSDKYVFLAEFVLQAASLGYVLHVFLNASQTTERYLLENHKQAERQYLIIYKQKQQIEIMLKEIHHRVKNNLQIIASLLRLQSDISAEESKGILQECVNRVDTIAMIHEKMYKSDTFQQFDLENYVENLVVHVCDSYSLGEPVTAHVEVEQIEVSTSTIVPMAMIINELIANSIKHAFENQPKPKIDLIIESLPDAGISLTYEDNGEWKGENESFGTEIITVMTEQLEGEKVIEKSSAGTKFSFVLKNL